MQLLFSGAEAGEETRRGVKGILGIVDLESGRVLHRTEYQTPEDRRAPEQKIQITGFCRTAETLYACTHNEVLVYEEWPPRAPARTISLPGFNDLHHCIVHDGQLAVANTGLETIDLLSLDGELVHRTDLLEGIPEAREVRDDVDYRLIPDTKPHIRHANHLFEVNGALWSTQLRTSDAICISAPNKRLDMVVGMPHDGDVIGDEIIFTTTNGHLVFHDPARPERFRTCQLADLTPGFHQLGWCRGVARHPGYENRYFVSFSKMRRTRWREFAYRAKHGHSVPQGRICEYDLERGELIETHFLGKEDPGYVLFQLEVLPESHWV